MFLSYATLERPPVTAVAPQKLLTKQNKTKQNKTKQKKTNPILIYALVFPIFNWWKRKTANLATTRSGVALGFSECVTRFRLVQASLSLSCWGAFPRDAGWPLPKEEAGDLLVCLDDRGGCVLVLTFTIGMLRSSPNEERAGWGFLSIF